MTYASSVADAIVDALSRSSLRNICAQDGMPDRTTVERWIMNDPAFATRCARARELHADHIVEGHADIEAGLLSGTVDPAAARVVISSQQWRASKMHSRRYGDRTVLAGDPDAPLSAGVNIDMRGATAEQLRAIASLVLPGRDDALEPKE